MSIPANAQEIAAHLIALYQAEAKDYAAAKADEMLAAGKLYERHTWRRVQVEIDRAPQRDLLGDFCGLVAWPGLLPDENAARSEALPPKIWPLSTKWKSS
jgi:hypothetical protein